MKEPTKKRWTASQMGRKGMAVLNEKLGEEGRRDRAKKASNAASVKRMAKNKAQNCPQVDVDTLTTRE